MKKTAIIISVIFAGSTAAAQTGNVGIGTTAPTANLHIKTDNEFVMRVEDGTNTDYADYVVISEDDKGTFKKQQVNAFRTAYTVALPASSNNITSSSWQDTGVTVNVQNGRWSVVANLVLKCTEDMSSNTNTAIIVKASLADPTGTLTPSPDIEGNTEGSTAGTGIYQGTFNLPLNKGLLTGSIVVNNSGDVKNYRLIANKDYYGTNVTCTIYQLGRSDEKQNIIYALPLNF